MVLLRAFNKAGKRTLTIPNETIKREAMLNDNYFSLARRQLDHKTGANLVRIERNGKSAYRYTLLKHDGKELSDMTVDTWGTKPWID